MRNFFILLVCLILSIGVNAEEIVRAKMPDASRVGSGRFTYLLWDVYDATLYAPGGKWESSKPFALTLHYLRSIEGEDIADHSAEEIRQQGFENEVKLAGWYSQMKAIFPNVENGSTLTGMYVPNKPTRFFSNNKQIGVIHDPEFGEWFFNIWLSEKSSEPALRKKLLGML